MQRFFLVRLVCVLGTLLFTSTYAAAQARRALVIGIDEYKNVEQLKRATADARAVAGQLKDIGFDVQLSVNAGRNQMSAIVANYEEKLAKGDIAFVYFAGHGVEIKGQNYLLPADVPSPNAASEGILKDSGFSAASLIDRITDRGTRSAFFIFDACRDNPYDQPGKRSLGSSKGLARMEAAEGVFVLMSAGPKQSALDRLNNDTDVDPNSVFTRVLLDEMKKPGASHLRISKNVQTRVRELALSVNHTQLPDFRDWIIGEVVFRPEAEGAPKSANLNFTPTPEPTPAPPPQPRQQQALLVPQRQAVASDYRIDRCDELAGGDFDSSLPGNIKPELYDKINACLAQPACRNAYEAFSDIPRLAFQLARSIGRTSEANPEFKRLMLQAANSGHARSMIVIGNMHLYGTNMPKDYTEAMRWFQKSLSLGNGMAATSVAKMYADGQGVSASLVEAARYYQMAADAGHDTAQVNLGFAYENGRGVPVDINKAVDLYRKAALQNHPNGLNNMGVLYREGRGVQRDYNEAMRYYRKAAELGLASALTNLGYAFEVGQGVPADLPTAIEYYRNAAEKGEAIAQNNMGVLYRDGRGVSVDHVKAVGYFRQAVDNGSMLGMTNLGYSYEVGRGGLPADINKAVEYYRMAANKGETIAMDNLGVLHREGRGVKKDYAEAMRWFRKAADLGQIKSLNNIGYLYDAGLGVEQDKREAVRYYRQSANAGNGRGIKNLGFMYQAGAGVERNMKEAAVLMLRALREGDAYPDLVTQRGKSPITGDLRVAIQERMRSEGFYNGPINADMGDSFDATTIAALQTYARAR